MTSQAFTLSIDTSLIGIGTDAVRAVAILRRATVFDSFVIVPDLKETITLSAGVGTVKLLANTKGSVYEFTIFNAAGNKILGCFFIMPEGDAALVDLNLLTAWGGDSTNNNTGSGGRRRIVRYTTNATLKLSDAGCIIECDSATPMTLTVPAFADVAFRSAIFADIVQIGAGSVTVVGDTGVTVESNGLVLNAPSSMGYLYRRDAVNDFVFSNTPPANWNTLTNRPDNLVSLGGLTGAANFFPAFSGLGTLILKAISSFGYSFVAAADATAAKLLLSLTKSDVGLSNVANLAPVDMPVSTAQAAADTATLNSANTYADGGDLATLNSAKAYTDAMTTGLLQFIGNWSASGGLYPTTGGSGVAGAVVIGDVWRVDVAGTMGGVNYRVGDSFYATSNTPAQDPTKWASILLELGYNPEDVSRKATNLTSPDNTKYPTTLAVANALSGKFTYIGTFSFAGGAYPTTGGSGTAGAILKGDLWRISVAGSDGATTYRVEDAVYALVDSPTVSASDWGHINNSPNVFNQTYFAPKQIAELTPNNPATNVGISISPKGSGGFSLKTPTTGVMNSLGTYSIDLQLRRGLATEVASGSSCYTFGEFNTATGLDSVAIGSGNTVTGTSASAIGTYCAAAGNNSIAMGALTVSSGAFSIALGSSASANSNESIALGHNTTATGVGAIALGISALTNAVNAIAIGTSTQATGIGAVAIGVTCNASGKYSRAVGQFAIASLYGENAQTAATFNTNGDNQNSTMQLGVACTAASTAYKLTSDLGVASSSNQLFLNFNTLVSFSAIVTANRRSTEGSESMGWLVTGLARRASSGNIAFVGTPVITPQATAPTGWTLTVNADTTTQAVQLVFNMGTTAMSVHANALMTWVKNLYG